jgi:hypothetical protein
MNSLAYHLAQQVVPNRRPPRHSRAAAFILALVPRPCPLLVGVTVAVASFSSPMVAQPSRTAPAPAPTPAPTAVTPQNIGTFKPEGSLTKTEALARLRERAAAVRDASIPIVATLVVLASPQTYSMEGGFATENDQSHSYRFRISWGFNAVPCLGEAKYEIRVTLNSIPVGSDYDLSVRSGTSISSSAAPLATPESIVFLRNRKCGDANPFNLDVDVLKYSGPATNLKYSVTATYRGVTQ